MSHSDFRVETGHLRGFAEQVHGNADDLRGIRSYTASTCGDTGGWGGLLSLLVDEYQASVSAAEGAYGQWATALDKTGTSLEKNAKNYEDADRGGSDRFDSINPGQPPAKGGETATAGGYSDAADPAASLKPPQDYGDVVRSQVDEIGGIVGIINDVYEWVTGESLLQKIVEPISGDWGKVYANADAWGSVGNAMMDVRANLEQGASQLDPHWDGETSAKFQAHMSKWGTLFSDENQFTKEMQNKLRDLAENTRESFDVIIQTLNTVWSIISAAMASFAIPVYGQAKLVKAVWDTAKLIWNIYKIINLIRQTVEMVVQLVQAFQEAANDTGRIPQTAG